ncbi:PucR family transcriptional regulator [Desulfoscipio gibsoniae]
MGLSALGDKSFNSPKFNNDVYRQLIEMLLEGKGIRGIMDAIYVKLEQKILLISSAGKVIYYTGYKRSPSVVLTLAFLGMDKCKTCCAEKVPEQINVQIDDSNADCFVIPVLKKGKKIAFLLAVVEGNYLNHQLSEYLQVIAQVLALELDRENHLLLMEQKYKTEFIIDLFLNTDQDKEKLNLVSRAWGRNLSEPHLVFIVAYDISGNDNGKNTHFTQIIKSDLRQFIGENFLHLTYNNMQIILVRLKDVDKLGTVDLMRKVYKKISHEIPAGSKLLFTGQSIFRCDYNLGKGYKEAHYSLQLGLMMAEESAFILFDELGIYGILYDICNNKEIGGQLNNFYEQKIGKLIDYDQQHNTELYNTLIAYVDNNCNNSLTAEKLFIHVNSLRYRINKIEKILKADLSKLECMAEILLALKIYKMQKCLTGNSRED